MGIIRTVRGDIQPSELGVAYAHEHLLTDPPPQVADADFRMGDVGAALAELRHFRAAGGRAIVEMTPRDYGRDAAGLRRLSEASGVHIICATGWLKEAIARPWLEGRSVNALADELIREVEEGIDATGVRAGVIKASSSLNRITPLEERALRAAARAQRETGAPISTHTEAGTMGLEQVALLRAEGVDPERIVIGHCDRRLDEAYHRALLATGVTIGYDQVGKEKYYPDARRVELLLRLVGDGFGAQILLSGDMARRSNWPSYGGWGGPGLTYLLWRFAPWLRAAGLAAEEIERLLVRNPARVFQLAR